MIKEKANDIGLIKNNPVKVTAIDIKLGKALVKSLGLKTGDSGKDFVESALIYECAFIRQSAGPDAVRQYVKACAQNKSLFSQIAKLYTAKYKHDEPAAK